MGQRSSVVEQRFRKPQVDGSNPSVGSIIHPMIDFAPEKLGGLALYPDWAIWSRNGHGSLSLLRCEADEQVYILIQTSVGKSEDVVTQLRSHREVQEADRVIRPHDVIAVVEAEDLNAVGDLVASRVHTLDGIVRTEIRVSVGSFP